MVNIKGLQKTSLIDYPGKVCAVVFLGGCNFRCPYCQNPDLISAGGAGLGEEEFFRFLGERKKWIDGVCLSGGEPTVSKGLPEFIRKIKADGLLVKLDTNGTSPEMLRELLANKQLDYIAMDIKGPFEKYVKVANAAVDIEKIKESIEIIKSSGVGHEFRSTILPALHSREDIVEMAREVAGTGTFYLQGFRNISTLDPAFRKERSFSKEEMEGFKKECSKHVRTELRN